jgi:hypothetical protein
LINIMRQILYMSWEVVENFDTSIISPIFVCCQCVAWSMKIRIIPSVNTMYFRIHLKLSLIIYKKLIKGEKMYFDINGIYNVAEA